MNTVNNTTDFPLKILNKLKEIPYSDDEYLMYYQKVIKNYYTKFLNARGLLLMFEVGLGKTITATSISEEFVDLGRNIIVLAPASLHENMRLNIEKYRQIAKITRTGFSNYKFISMNSSNMIKQFSRVDKIDSALDKFIDRFTTSDDLNNKLIIVDECHNLFNSIVNGSKNASKFYDLVMGAKNLKLLFLSGTPVVNTPFELVPCFNMLFGPVEIETIKIKRKYDFDFRFETLLPEDYDLFMKSFVQKEEKQFVVKNKQKLQNRISGMVSYYGRKYNDESDKHFPKSNLKIIEVPMSNDQFKFYNECRDLERAESNRKKFQVKTALLNRPSSSNVSTYRVRSRQVGDFFLPDPSTRNIKMRIHGKAELIDDISTEVGINPETEINSNIEINPETETNTNVETNTETEEEEYKKSLFDYKNTEYSYIAENLQNFSPKLKYILDNLGEGLCVMYSAFVKHTLFITSKVLEHKGYKLFKSQTEYNEEGPKYAIISGSIKAEDRDKIIKVFKTKENKNGDIIKIILLSSAGSEGIDFKNVRHMYIFEPHWNYSRIKQIIARAVRFDSHIDLPEEERTVNSYLFLASEPQSKLQVFDQSNVLSKSENEDNTTDINIFSKALVNNILIEQFLTLLQEVAVDCSLYSDKCYMCKPTGEKLFELDFNKDIKLPSPCQPLNESKATVKEYNVAGKKYYKDDNDNIYVYDSDLKGYVELDQANYGKILELIKNI